MHGTFRDCYFHGNNYCEDSSDNHVIITNCRAWDQLGTTINTGQAKVTIQGWISHLIVAGKYGSNQVSINSEMGKITINDTCVEGTINLSGTGYPIDNSSANCTVLVDKLNNKQMQAEAVWSSQNGVELVADVSFIKSIEGGRWKLINNQMIFYGEDGISEIAKFDLFNKEGNMAEENIYERRRHS
jgi:hypothetical protein